jgi:hypothetical protein
MFCRQPNDFVDPALLAELVRHCGVLAVAQIPNALKALGYSPRKRDPRLRHAVASLLRTCEGEFELSAVYAHPAAVDSWGLLWRLPNGKSENSCPPDCISALIHNWARAWHPVETLVLCRRQAFGFFMPTRFRLHVPGPNSGDSTAPQDLGYATAVVLRTSVWIDLLRDDAEAALSWKSVPLYPDHDELIAASYLRRDRTRVTVAIPHVLPNRRGGRAGDESRLRWALQRLPYILDGVVEIYSLKFPTCKWPAQSPRE